MRVIGQCRATMTKDEPLIAGIELGGTKCIATLARGTRIERQEHWPTGDPATLELIAGRLAQWRAETPFTAIGIASFGPLALDRSGPDFGHMGNTPKPGWAGVDIYGAFARRFDLPIGFDTDVNGAALAEGQWGAAAGCAVHAYATVGTGVGLGIVVNGAPSHGHMHPEAGHVRIRRQPGDAYPGACPAHGDCLEGLVSGPGLIGRAPAPLDQVGDDDPLWPLVAADLAEWAATLVLTLSPQRLVLGGGVMQARPMLLPMIRRGVLANLAGYLADVDAAAMETLLVPPALGDRVGPLGAIMLGLKAIGVISPRP